VTDRRAGEDGPCDCKYARTADTRPSSEATGCCELRDLIKTLTGWSPFNSGQTIADDLARFDERERHPERFEVPAESKIVALMAALEQSVKEAREARDARR